MEQDHAKLRRSVGDAVVELAFLLGDAGAVSTLIRSTRSWSAAAFARYADDCNIYLDTEAEAQLVYTEITEWIETRLKLKINRDKSGTGRPWERKLITPRPTNAGSFPASCPCRY